MSEDHSMKLRIATLSLALGLAVMSAAPATAQMWNFPDYMVPAMRGAPTSWVSADFGRGVNNVTGEENGLALAYGRTGEAVNFMLAGGILTGDFDNEFTFGASVGGDIMESEGLVMGVQGGFGWISPGDLTLIEIPVGLSLRTESEMANGGALIPWVMPRLNIGHASLGGESDTELDLGISGGVTVTFLNGVGVHAALDYLMAEGDDPVLLGFGVHYLLGSRN
jgi:hypothetical protein